MRAMSCPALTGSLKSTLRAAMRPETWLPTSTVSRVDTVPLAVMDTTMCPRVTGAVSKVTSAVPPWRQRATPNPPATVSRTAPPTSQRQRRRRRPGSTGAASSPRGPSSGSFHNGSSCRPLRSPLGLTASVVPPAPRSLRGRRLAPLDLDAPRLELLLLREDEGQHPFPEVGMNMVAGVGAVRQREGTGEAPVRTLAGVIGIGLLQL